MDSSQLNFIYKNIPRKDIPWIRSNLPKCLLKLVNQRIITPCRMADLGCGTGNYSLCFSKLGFEIYGYDFSEIAIEKAKQLFKTENRTAYFHILDLSKPLVSPKLKFKFAFDYEVLHHIFPLERMQYVKNIFELLETDGIYLSVCFSEDDTCFGSKDKYRITPLGTLLYFSSEKEIEKLMSPLFHILELKTILVKGKPKAHQAIYCLMQKKSSN
ncbi:class I SAM-dependent methyltransferase [Labilibaculum sp.]|uniref:class I SAM-dependent methyltransferase n=1 Tax=Labilibaculum sp. TaxID=2060723 RepID=UPI003569BD31